MKKVIVLSTSLRPGSNPYALAEQFAKGAEAAGQKTNDFFVLFSRLFLYLCENKLHI